MPFLLVVRTERYFRVLSGKLFISMRMKALICWPGVIRMKLGSTSHTTMTNIPPDGVTCCLSRSQKDTTHIPLYRENLPEKDRWLIEAIGYFFTRIHEIDSISDFDKEESEFEELKADIKNRYPKIEQYAMTSLMLAPILDNLQIEEDARVALWENKVYLDSIYHE